MPMKHFATIEVTGSAQDVQFTNIPQTHTDLYVTVSAGGRTTDGGVGALVTYTATGQSSSLSTWKNIQGTGTSVYGNNSAYPIVGTVQHTSSANVLGSTTIHIPNYTSSAKKIFIYESATEENQSTAYITCGGLVINYTPAITFLGFGDGSYGGGLRVGSTISLYGIK